MGLVPKLKLVTVTTAGTAVPILGSTDKQDGIVSCTIQSVSGTVWVGDSTVKASTLNGIALLSTAVNNTLNLTNSDNNGLDLAKVFLDGSANGAKASVLYFVRV